MNKSTATVIKMLTELDMFAKECDSCEYGLPDTIEIQKIAKLDLIGIKSGKIDAECMLTNLDEYARECDSYEYGLPINSEYHLTKMIEIVNSYL